jgi:microcin C transport system substrate-binding protein
MDEYNFDMTWAAWSSGIFKDPESMWSSAEADRKGGNNITGSGARRGRTHREAEVHLRPRATQRHLPLIDAIVTDQVPYVLLWNLETTRLLYWDKFGMPPTVLSKYGDERSLLAYWWYDADSQADLEAAMAVGEALPPRPDVIDFDTIFSAP